MSVFVTMRVSVDPAAFESAAGKHTEAIGRIMEIAKSNGLIAHRWFRGEDCVMAVDEWPDAANFQAFMAAAGSEIGPFMADAGVTSPPDITVWGSVEMADVYGWGA